ncbi:F-box only protein 36 isoform X2 [Pongo pygmaeus]|uniref:F-box only protein 36 isoform X2 n=1 Tax=Pongo pygmaeus TaxID=9600 RepID=UPI00300D80A9
MFQGLYEVIYRWWKISLRSEYRSTKPGEAKETHEDFLENSHLQGQTALIFGARILDYVINLCKGKFDFLERLSDDLLLNIISYLDLEDIARLCQTSHRFAKNEVHGRSQHSHGALALPPATLCPARSAPCSSLCAVLYCAFCLCLLCSLFQEYSPPDSSTTGTSQMPLDWLLYLLAPPPSLVSLPSSRARIVSPNFIYPPYQSI